METEKSTECNPPKYSATGDPPNYDSIVGKFHRLQDESHGEKEFFSNMVEMSSGGTAAGIMGIVLFCVVPVASLVIGVLNLDNCPIEKMIPIYLVVSGAFGLFKAFLMSLNLCFNKVHGKQEVAIAEQEDADCKNHKCDKKKKRNPLEALIDFYLFCWFIAGSVWVFRNFGKVVYDSPSDQLYCDKTTYLFTFALLITCYAVGALTVCCCCTMVCIYSCKKAGSEAHQHAQDSA